ncbi:hypothetical protein ADK41_22275 [Streptomyces caelestis]|uniref:Uncharacterized protein n=1 Tax=Streptomyces caelestis TaxID=36816 RepID=A0A0N0S5M2_9ACTN|nr:hypothetical protein ADK41_22275 [Streptomyces caelestis]
MAVPGAGTAAVGRRAATRRTGPAVRRATVNGGPTGRGRATGRDAASPSARDACGRPPLRSGGAPAAVRRADGPDAGPASASCPADGVREEEGAPGADPAVAPGTTETRRTSGIGGAAGGRAESEGAATGAVPGVTARRAAGEGEESTAGDVVDMRPRVRWALPGPPASGPLSVPSAERATTESAPGPVPAAARAPPEPPRDTAGPDGPAPEAPEPPAPEPGRAESGDAARETPEPEDAEPEDPEPEDAEPERAEPEDAEPEAPEPGRARSGDTARETPEPEDAEPEDPEPEDAEPEGAEPEGAGPEEPGPGGRARLATGVAGVAPPARAGSGRTVPGAPSRGPSPSGSVHSARSSSGPPPVTVARGTAGRVTPRTRPAGASGRRA